MSNNRRHLLSFLQELEEESDITSSIDKNPVRKAERRKQLNSLPIRRIEIESDLTNSNRSVNSNQDIGGLSLPNVDVDAVGEPSADSIFSTERVSHKHSRRFEHLASGCVTSRNFVASAGSARLSVGSGKSWSDTVDSLEFGKSSASLYNVDGGASSKHHRLGAIASIEYGTSCNRGKRKTMEDAFLVLPLFHQHMTPFFTQTSSRVSGFFAGEPDADSILYCGVFDGHNGSRAADYAKTHLQRLIKLHLRSNSIGLESRMTQFTENSLRLPFKKQGKAGELHPEMKKLYEQSLVDSFNDLDKEYSRSFPHTADGTTALVLLADLNCMYSHCWSPAKLATVHNTLKQNDVEQPGIFSSSWLHLGHVGDCRAVLGRTKVAEDFLVHYSCDVSKGGHSEPTSLLGPRCPISEKDVGYSEGAISRDHKRKRNQSAEISPYSSSKTLRSNFAMDVKFPVLECVRLTSDHKPNRIDEQLRIESHGGSVIDAGCPRVGVAECPYWLAVSRAIGDFPLKRLAEKVLISDPECAHYLLVPYRDVFVIVSSDGIWDVCTEQHAVNIVGKYFADSLKSTPPIDVAALQRLAKGAAEKLILEALERGATDNLTCVVLFFRWRTTKLQNAQSSAL